MRAAVLFACCLLPILATAERLVLEGTLPDDGPDFFELPFTVPAGIVEIEVAHDDLSDANVLDFGLRDPNGARGWGGGNREPAIVGVEAASRSYVPGPIPAGEWRVLVGRAQVLEPPARYRVEITLREAPTLPPQTERRPYSPVAPLSQERRWYLGDFHVHSRESGDARPTIDEVAAFARSRGLDFVELSEHNTDAHVTLLADAQARHPEVLLIPGVEFTTYAGHANGIGVTTYVDHRLGLEGVTIESAARAIRGQGALFALNHPMLALGDLCIGCAWQHDLDPALIDAIEIGTGGWSEGGFVFTPQVLAMWDALSDEGHRIAPIGGSDDHRAGQSASGPGSSPIGSPTTRVLADRLDVAAIVEAVRRGRTVVQLQGPDDPFVELTAGDAVVGDTLAAESATLVVRVTEGAGHSVRLVRDGVPLESLPVTADPFEATFPIEVPVAGTVRYRAEVLVDGAPRTVTNHLWVTRPSSDGCGCGAGAGAWPVLGVLAGALLGRRRRSA